MQLHFRKCVLQDVKQLKILSISTFVEAFESQNDPQDFKVYLDTAFSKEQLLSELKNPNTSFYFVLIDQTVAGYFKVNVFDAQSEFQDSQAMELERIYVQSRYQGQGVGSDILVFIEALAQKQMKAYLWLGVWEQNSNAIRFYERQGYLKFGTHPYYIGQDKQTDWLMKKELTL